MSDKMHELSDAEWLLIQDVRRRRVFDNGRNKGLEEAAQKAEIWASEGGSGYRNLAASIRQLMSN
jgi:hypothetical protein